MAEDRLTMCLSLAGARVSQYANFNFRGMCKFNNTLVGGNEDGLFKLESSDKDDDEDITAFFRTGPTDFGVENEKRLRKLYVSFRTDGDMKLSTSGDGKSDVMNELVSHDKNLNMVHQKVKGGRDIRGKFLDLKVENVAGSDFTVNEIKAVLIILGKNTKEGV